ncbi:MAG TPA: AI-2E family transporter [Streptosporangiaceae bacterium]
MTRLRWREVRGAARGLATATHRDDAGTGEQNRHPAGTATGPPGPGSRPSRPASESHAAGPGEHTPRWLQRTAGWAWRLLVIGLLVYVAARIASALRIVVIPCVVALLLTALLQPLCSWLKRLKFPGLLAAWCVLILTIAVIAGLGTLIYVRTSDEYTTLLSELTHTGHQLQNWLAGPPFHIKQMRLQQLLKSAENELSAHKSLVAGTVLTGGKYAVEILAGIVLTLFVGFFLIKDGDRIWSWLTGFFAPERADRADRAGRAAWLVLVHYVRGSVLIAAIHSVVIGLTLWFLGVPLVIPLAALVFLAAFVPLIGILVAGALAILVTLGTKGLVAAIILLVVFVVEDQLDGHLLQPQVVGRILRLHPLAVILVLAVGGVLAGIPGAVVAVPTAAAIARAWPELRSPADPDTLARIEEERQDEPHEDSGQAAEALGEQHVPM